MNNKEFSILIPVYGTEKYIRDCIESVLSQTYPAANIIVVDDGSPDRAGEICDEYAEKDSRITVLHQNNRGLAGARDTAIRYFKQIETPQSVVMFLDSDDMLLPNALERVNDIFCAEEPDMVMFRWNDMDENGNLVDPMPDDAAVETMSDKRELYRKVFSDYGYNSLCIKAIRSGVITEQEYQDYYHISQGEDLLRSIAIFKACKTVTFIGDRLYLYRQNQTSIMHTVDYSQYSPDSTVRKAVWDMLIQENVWTSEDYRLYLGKMRTMMEKEIRNLAMNCREYKNLRASCEQFTCDEYYAMLLDSGSGNHPFLYLMRGQHYRSLWIAGGLFKWLYAAYHFIRKMK